MSYLYRNFGLNIFSFVFFCFFLFNFLIIKSKKMEFCNYSPNLHVVREKLINDNYLKQKLNIINKKKSFSCFSIKFDKNIQKNEKNQKKQNFPKISSNTLSKKNLTLNSSKFTKEKSFSQSQFNSNLYKFSNRNRKIKQEDYMDNILKIKSRVDSFQKSFSRNFTVGKFRCSSAESNRSIEEDNRQMARRLDGVKSPYNKDYLKKSLEGKSFNQQKMVLTEKESQRKRNFLLPKIK